MHVCQSEQLEEGVQVDRVRAVDVHDVCVGEKKRDSE